MYDGQLVRLRGVRLEDLDDIMENWNKYELRHFLYDRMPHSRQEEENWIRSTWEGMRSGRDYVFAIESLETSEFLGTTGLHGVQSISRRAFLGIAIHDPQNWGRGFGSDALDVLLRIAFDVLNLHRAELEVYEWNTRAFKAYKKQAFRKLVDVVKLTILKANTMIVS